MEHGQNGVQVAARFFNDRRSYEQPVREPVTQCNPAK
jgi:hypothetical protein